MSRIGSGRSARNKPRSSQDVCGDCGAVEPSWASINRGILICDECCSVHRSLGRHISQVKSLKKGSWHPIQLAMVHTLNSSGANSIWEHTLLDPSVAKIWRKKPQAKDPVHPTKADFIRAKHQMMSFVYRPARDDINTSPDGDVSRQLHSSVRTANLETSLRLLSQGADANYLNNEKGTCPLHVAARAGQSSQAELLLVYGADPGALDLSGHTPSHYAKEAGYTDLAEHLDECQYELTDRLAIYVCGRKPDHSVGQHWIIPEMVEPSMEGHEGVREARWKLQSLANYVFEELACDVYDEVDRRETDAICFSQPNQAASDRCAIPFLPVNPEFSATRNQGRQKLARLNPREFTTLIIDVLLEAKRRQTGSLTPVGSPKDTNDSALTPKQATLRHNFSQILSLPDNSGHLSSPPTFPTQNTHESPRQTAPSSWSPNSPAGDAPRQNHVSPVLSPVGSAGAASQARLASPVNSRDNIKINWNGLSTGATGGHTPIGTVPETLGLTDDNDPLYDSVASEDDYAPVETLQKLQQQRDFLAEQRKRQQMTNAEHDYHEVYIEGNGGMAMDSISRESYSMMKQKLESSEARIHQLQQNNEQMKAQLNELSSTVQKLMYERASLQSTSPQHKVKSLRAENNNLRGVMYNNLPVSGQYPMDRTGISGPSSLPQQLLNGDSNQVGARGRLAPQRPASMFEPREGWSRYQPSQEGLDFGGDSSPEDLPLTQWTEYDGTRAGDGRFCEEGPELFTPSPISLPSQDEVVRKTEAITRRIQELLISAQEGRQSDFIPCADQINSAVLEMASIFPKMGGSAELQVALLQLVTSADHLQREFRGPYGSPLNHSTTDPKYLTQQVIQCAFEIAKAAKILVTHFQ